MCTVFISAQATDCCLQVHSLSHLYPANNSWVLMKEINKVVTDNRDYSGWEKALWTWRQRGRKMRVTSAPCWGPLKKSWVKVSTAFVQINWLRRVSSPPKWSPDSHLPLLSHAFALDPSAFMLLLPFSLLSAQVLLNSLVSLVWILQIF